MSFNRLLVVRVPEALRPVLDYDARVFVGSDVALHAETSVAAMLGGQPIDGFEVQQPGESLSGYVKVMPQIGDELRVAINSGELVDTGLTFQPEVSGPIA